jgi:hydroxymethylglutaryl-CoA reductase (NADPH)
MFPSYLLQKVYQKGSLKNTEDGFEFALKNIVDSGTLVGLNPLVVDGESIPPAMVRLVSDEKEVFGNQVSNRAPVPIPMNVQTRLIIKSSPLQPGPHEITISMVTREIGLVKFKITDSIE